MPRQALPFGLKRYGGNTFDKLHKCGSGCITASQIADLFGEGREGKYALYAHVIGLLDMSPDESELMERGHMLQPVAAKMYQKETGRKTRNIHARVKHPDLDFYASPDVLTVYEDGDGEEEPGEIKVLTYDTYETHWQGGPPKRVLLQHQAQLLLTGAQRGPIICLIDGDYTFRLHHWDVKAHKGVQLNILKRVTQALKEIANHQLPPPDLTHAGDQDALIRLAQGHIQDAIDLDPDIQDQWDLHQRLGKLKSKLEKKRKEAKARIVDALKGHARGKVGDHLIELKKITVEGGFREGYTITKIGAKSLAAIRKRAEKAA